PDRIFAFLVNSYGTVAIFVYALIAVAELRLRARLEREMPERLRIRMWGYPWLTRLAILAMLAIVAAMSVIPEQRAPLVFGLLSVLVAVFKKYGLEISMDEARKPMGLRKDLHIKALTEIPSVRQRFTAKFDREPTQADVDKMFAVFVPTQIDLLKSGNYHELLPGTAEVVHKMQKNGIRIGVTTGFTRDMLDILLAGAAKQGFNPDASCAGDEV